MALSKTILSDCATKASYNSKAKEEPKEPKQEVYVEPLEGTEKELADIFTDAQEEIDKVVESFNPVPATDEQKERLEKFCEGLVKVELTPIQKMSDNELCRKLDIARRNVEKWQKRVDDIQRERSSRYCHWKSMQDPEW